MFKVGDKVEVYNAAETLEGTVIAVLHMHPPFPVIVEHPTFGGGTRNISQAFNQEGKSDGRVVSIRHARTVVQMNVTEGYWASHVWMSKKEAEAARANNPSRFVGYLQGSLVRSDSIVNDITYTIL